MGRSFGDSDSIAVWRKRAANMRTIARTTRGDEARADLLGLAAEWDRLAVQAARRLGLEVDEPGTEGPGRDKG
jgi:hypothetical protein